MRNHYFLMRHGESLANLAGRIISDPQTGCAGYGLSERGRRQVRRSITRSGLGPGTRIIASDFLRTRETAAIVAAALGCPRVRLAKALRERFFGDFEAKASSNYEKVWQQDLIQPNGTFHGVESAARLTLRLRTLLSRLESTCSGESILLVSHGDPLRFLQVWAANRPLSEHLKIPLFAPAEIRPLRCEAQPATGSAESFPHPRVPAACRCR